MHTLSLSFTHTHTHTHTRTHAHTHIHIGPTAQKWAAQHRTKSFGGEEGTGEIIMVNGNWTVDVKWHSDGSTGRCVCSRVRALTRDACA